jgi:hypothetical protein
MTSPIATGCLASPRQARASVASLGVADLAHPPQHVDLAGPGLAEVAVGRVLRRRRDQPGQERGLGQRHVLDRLAEVGGGGGGYAVGLFSQKDLV